MLVWGNSLRVWELHSDTKSKMTDVTGVMNVLKSSASRARFHPIPILHELKYIRAAPSLARQVLHT